MKLFETEALSEKQREKLTGYFQIVRKVKEFQNGCTPVVMIALFGEKEGDRLWTSFAGKCDRDATMWLTYLSSEQRDIFWVQIIKYENLCKGIKEYGEI
jgi:hypothetical protein